jgi:hypothetical protein
MGDLRRARWLQAGASHADDQIAHVVDLFGGGADEQGEKVYSGNEEDYSENHEMVRAAI